MDVCSDVCTVFLMTHAACMHCKLIIFNTLYQNVGLLNVNDKINQIIKNLANFSFDMKLNSINSLVT